MQDIKLNNNNYIQIYEIVILVVAFTFNTYVVTVYISCNKLTCLIKRHYYLSRYKLIVHPYLTMKPDILIVLLWQ